jgi:acetyl esterase/lipase
MASWQSRLLKPVLRRWQRKRDLTRPIEEERAEFEAVAARFPKARGVQYRSLEIQGVSAERILAAGAREEDLILYLHGGCYILGSFKTERVIATTLSRLTGASVLSPNYRLAPEHPFPAAVDDALGIYKWVLEQGSRSCTCSGGWYFSRRRVDDRPDAGGT